MKAHLWTSLVVAAISAYIAMVVIYPAIFVVSLVLACVGLIYTVIHAFIKENFL